MKKNQLGCVENVEYAVHVDYDYERNCEEYGCDSICRCSKVVESSIRDDINPSSVFGAINKAKTDEHKYLVDRLISILHGYSPDGYYVNVYRDYYGEVAQAKFNECEKFEKISEELLNMSFDDAIRHLLKLEYGYLLPNLKGNYRIDTIPTKLIKFGPGYKKIDREYSDKFKDWTLPLGILTEGYLVIDGHHRIAANLFKKKIKCLINHNCS